MNINLLRQIQTKITEEPKQFRMSAFFSRGCGIPNCGTAACIGGWAVALHNKMNPRDADRLFDSVMDPSIDRNPCLILGLGLLESERLFHVGNWPSQFASDWEWAKTPEAMVKVACDRIDHFIATEGRE